MASDPKTELLSSIPLFARLGKKDIERLGQLFEQIDVPAGHVLMRQGAAGSEMFIVVSGEVTVERDGKSLGERGPGAVVGEIALLAHVPRVATVTAVTPTRFFVVAGREFRALMDEMPSVRTAILEVLASRISTLDPQSA
jgi:CRP-like cAMP-binding protein